VAIIAMMVFHFGEGVFKELPQLEALRTPVLWFGRMATPTFIVVFGVTAGFVFLPKFIRGEVATTSSRLWRRACWILFCSVLIAIPVWIRFGIQGQSGAWRWSFELYSVLLFYALALAILPWQLRLLSHQTELRALLMGVVFWFIGTRGFYLWPEQPPSGSEFARMMLMSGSYAYFQMMGTAFLAMPIGLQLKKARDEGRDGAFFLNLLGAGLFLSALGAVWGTAVGEYEPAAIVSGALRVPARAWYFLHFGAMALVWIAGLELLTRGVRWLRAPGYVLALFGQTSLVLFTGHMFVLPTLDVIKSLTPLHGAAKVVVAFVPFLVFCALVMYGRHRRLQRDSTPRQERSVSRAAVAVG
jgi:hypothetical protein